MARGERERDGPKKAERDKAEALFVWAESAGALGKPVAPCFEEEPELVEVGPALKKLSDEEEVRRVVDLPAAVELRAALQRATTLAPTHVYRSAGRRVRLGVEAGLSSEGPGGSPESPALALTATATQISETSSKFLVSC